ncbi:MAG TPA: hypothetical protein VIY27_03995 [Myxococcota bacterium]
MAALGLSRQQFTATQSARLMEPFETAEYRIKPTGEVYVPHVCMRRRLNLIFGPGRWGLNPVDQPKVGDGRISQTFDLYVDGMPCGRDAGETRFNPGNRRGSRVQALSGAQSSALTKIGGKVLGMGLECWDSAFQYEFKMRHGVCVMTRNNKGERERAWRSVHQPPYESEIGIADDSPNREQYQAPTSTTRAAAAAYRPPTDEQQAAAERGEVALAPINDGVLEKAHHARLAKMCRAHGITETQFKEWLAWRFKIETRAAIRKSWLQEVEQWIQSPSRYRPGEDDPVGVDIRTGEVVD